MQYTASHEAILQLAHKVSRLGPLRPLFIFQIHYPISKVPMPFFYCWQLDFLLMVHVAELRLDLVKPKSFESKKVRHRAFREFALRARCPFSTLDDGSVQRLWSPDNLKTSGWIRDK
jgi:hypothetical protein